MLQKAVRVIVYHDKHYGAKNCLLLMARRRMELDFVEGVCCIARLNFVLFAIDYNDAEGVCCILGRNFVIFYSGLQ